jgi:hypothetical protein
LFTFFVDKAGLPHPTVQIGSDVPVDVAVPGDGGYAAPAPGTPGAAVASVEALVEVPLGQVAHARSGDKGDMSNIAVFCRQPRFMDHLREVLTPQRVLAQFPGLVDGPAVRYEAPGLAAFNFVLDHALGGGGMASQRIDAQGKAYGQRVLEMRVRVPASWVAPA